MSKDALDKFGSFLMTRVRDESISDFKMIIAGKMKGDDAERIRSALTGFSSDQLSVLSSIVPEVVDSVLHNLLWSLEQDEDVSLRVNLDNSESLDLNEISDGLAGELYGDYGWIETFSQEKS